MRRVIDITPSDRWDAASAIDRVVLDAGDRRRRRIAMTGENGTEFLLDFERPVTLRDGDGLLLDDGGVVQVAAALELLVEVSATSPSELARLAWHLGNRHTEVQVVGTKLRIRRDHVLEAMLRGLGAALTPLQAPFDPEGGAHDAPAHAHAHGHAHHHEHGHG